MEQEGGGYGAGVIVLWMLILIAGCRIASKVVDTWMIRSKLRRQGIGGPPPSFWYGNTRQMQEIQSRPPITTLSDGISHSDWVPSLLPYLHQWAHLHGPIFTYSTVDWQQHLYVGQPEFMRELSLDKSFKRKDKSLKLGKPLHLRKIMEPMLGRGIMNTNGPEWAIQRKLIAPEFYIRKVKGMLGLMEESANESIIRKWEREAEKEGGVAEIRVDEDLKVASADIISRVCFGKSYLQGKHIFSKLTSIQEAMSSPSFLFTMPLFCYVPTSQNRRIWRLQKEMESLILEVIEEREGEMRMGQCQDQYDLLRAVLESADEQGMMAGRRKRFIVDLCKTIYFAGQEATALAAAWTLMLLALYPDWQQRVRAEIFEHCCDKPLLNSDKLGQLKQLTMVVQESLRLYGPGVILAREALEETAVGDVVVPKGVRMWALAPALHRDLRNWGPDADEFKPERFSGGLSRACKNPHGYVPFGMGSRICVGQDMAMLELKLLMCVIVSKFSVSISPRYRHSPVFKMILKPQYGIPLLVTPLHEP